MMNAKNKSVYRRKWLSRGLLLLLVAGIIAAIASALLPKPVTADITTITRGELVVSVEEDGRTRVKDRYIVSAPLSGNLARNELEEGALVEANQVVARILPLPTPLLDPRSQAQSRARLAGSEAALRQSQAAEARARAALAHAKAEFERVRPLAQGGNVAKQRLDELEYQLAARREELASAQFASRVASHQVRMNQAALGRITSGPSRGEELLLRSPIDGVVLEVFKQSEGAVQVGTPVLELGDPKALEVVADLLTTEAVRVQQGAKALVRRWGGGEDLLAHVQRIEPKAFTKVSALGVEEQRVNVVLELDAPHQKWAALGDGYRVEVEIIVKHAEDVLRLPAGAVFRHDGGWSVYVVKDHVAERKEVTLGARSGLETEIVSGLEEGERVILHPSEKVNEGVSIEARR